MLEGSSVEFDSRHKYFFESLSPVDLVYRNCTAQQKFLVEWKVKSHIPSDMQVECDEITSDFNFTEDDETRRLN